MKNCSVFSGENSISSNFLFHPFAKFLLKWQICLCRKPFVICTTQSKKSQFVCILACMMANAYLLLQVLLNVIVLEGSYSAVAVINTFDNAL